MKKYFVLAVAVLSFFVITDTKALDSTQELLINTALEDYSNFSDNSNFNYCVFFYRDATRYRKIGNFYCFNSSPNISCNSHNNPSDGFSCDFTSFGSSYWSSVMTYQDNAFSNHRSGVTNDSSLNISYVYNESFISSSMYANYNALDSKGNVTFINFDFSVVIPSFTITFIPPSGTEIVVKDSNSNIIQPISQYVYELNSGNYTYSASNSLYTSLNDIGFSVSSDSTIEVNMQERINQQPMRSVFTQYYNYIYSLVSGIFNTDNPLFLFIISFIIGFSLIYLIKKMIGGIL